MGYSDSGIQSGYAAKWLDIDIDIDIDQYRDTTREYQGQGY